MEPDGMMLRKLREEWVYEGTGVLKKYSIILAQWKFQNVFLYYRAKLCETYCLP